VDRVPARARRGLADGFTRFGWLVGGRRTRTIGDVSEHGDLPDDAEQRLEQLEAAEDRYEQGRRLDKRFELFEAILLSVAAVLAAWAGFQSSQWSGLQDEAYNLASEARVEAAQASDRSGQEQVADLITFTEWLAAAEREGLLDDGLQVDADGYEPDPDLLSGFLYERFRPEFKVAVDAWVATSPDTNPDAPHTPFAMEEYVLQSDLDERAHEADAERFADEARVASDRSDDYVLMTILFATVLFFAGISSKMDTVKARVLLLSVGAVILVISGVIVLSLPKAW
jgi:hypothetical protein